MFFIISNHQDQEVKFFPLSIFQKVISFEFCSVINKMNKTRSSKLTHKSQQPMRLLFKMRGNPKGVMRTLQDDSQTEDLPNKSVAIVPSDDGEVSYQQRYGNNKMKTEYSDRFGLFRRNNHSFHHMKQAQQQHRSPQNADDLQSKTIASDNKSYFRLATPQFREDSVEKRTIDARREDEKLPQIREVPLTFEEIEDKIESIMTRRLNQCIQFKKKGDWVIDTELSKLVQAYKEVKTSKNPEVQEEDINLLSRRIGMLEKLIAQNMTESDIVKKYYLGKVANQHWKHNKTESFPAEPVRSINKEHRQESLVNTSNNRESYQQPQRGAYSLERRGNYSYNPDRHMQPLPRSSYKCDFLTYGGVQNMSACKPTQNQCLKGASSAKVMNSSYRSNFVPKKAEKINIKELDACRDKIKNLPIIFGKREKDMIAYNLAAFFRLKKQTQLDNNNTHSIEKIKMQANSNPHHFTSESRKQFIKAVQISPSQIKHKNLQKLKYNYKKELHV